MKKILVLCQRKSGWLYAGDTYLKIENTVAPRINMLVSSLVGDDYYIEYLSSIAENDTQDNVLSTGKVDIEGLLKKGMVLTLNENEKIPVSDFIAQNKGIYDLILLNTCPFTSMDYELISQLLAADGLMVFTAYNASERKINIERLKDVPIKFFTLADTHGDGEVLIYTKNKPHRKTPTYKKYGGRRRTRTVKRRHTRTVKRRHTVRIRRKRTVRIRRKRTF